MTEIKEAYVTNGVKKQLEEDLGFNEGDMMEHRLGYVEFEDPVRNCGYTQSPNVVARYPKVSPTARSLYAILTSFAYGADGLRKNYVFPTISTLSMFLGLSEPQVHRYKKELVEVGLIQVISRRRIVGSCRQMCNVYKIMNVPKEIVTWYKENVLDTRSPQSRSA